MTRKRAVDAVMALIGVFVLAGCGNGRPQGDRREGEQIAVTQQALPTDGQVCIALQRGAGGRVEDAILWQNTPAWNDGARTSLSTGTSATGGVRRSALRFELADVPAGATINSARLSVYQLYKSVEGTISGHQITVPWTESTVVWPTIGDNFSPVPFGSFIVPGGGSFGWRTLDVRSLVQSWVSNSAPNHGMLLIEEGATATNYRSSEAPTTAERPKLEVCYVTCVDGIQNGQETGVDCGGPFCGSCCVPSPEVCDGADNDCDGAVDDGLCQTPPDACHVVGSCDAASRQCVFPNAPDGAGCNDGNACTQADTCLAGACVGGNPVACAAQDACHVAGSCDPATGACSNPAAPDGTGCSDGNACTQTDTCQGGACVGASPVQCAAADACHVAGTCDPVTGACSNPAAPDGTGCNDGNACTQTDTCQAGVCVGTSLVQCAASDACHLPGTCNPVTGACSAGPAVPNGTACSDGNACTQVDTCLAGACVGASPVRCAASDACHLAGTCDPATGACSNPAAPDGTGCNDGNACTQVDRCQAGTCVGGSLVACAASDACHVAGTCDPATGVCSNPVAANGTACDDGNACTQTDTCQAGACTGGNTVTCAASDACHVAGACDPATGTCSNPVAANGTPCNDGDACTQMDICQAGACTGGNPVVCAASDACHAPGACDATTGACSAGAALADGTACDDGNGCTQGDSCQAGACAAGTPVTCAAVDGCHEAGTCDPAMGACGPGAAHSDGTACDDGNLGTQYDTCQAGSCVGANSVVINIQSPASGAIAATNTIQVTGTVDQPVRSVRIGEVQATVSGLSFSAMVPVHEGSNIIAVEAVGRTGNPGSASVVVGRDTRAPHVSITQPADRAVIVGNTTTVTGSVHDMLIGAVGTGDCTVTVNGIPAEVENGGFRAELVPVNEGAGTITVVATDAAGNAASAVIEVTGNLASSAMIVTAGGDGQTSVVGTTLEQPLTVQLLDNTGQPVSSRNVVFEVTRSNGILENGARSETVVSDAQGFASTTLTLGTSAGAGSDQVLAKAAGFLGAATFAANGVPDPVGERVLTVSSGGNQKGAPRMLAPLPLAVFLSDGQGNPVANQEVTFTVTKGGGRVDGASAIVKATDFDGRALVLLTMGSEIGDGTQIVRATVAGSNEVLFVGSTRAVADPAQTTITGLVLTNENDPIQNALVTIEGMPGVQGVTNAEGRFEIIVPLPADTVGYKRVHLDVIGATGGPFPSELEFEMDLIPGAENTMDRPVYLPAVDTHGVATASEAADVVIRRPDVPGFSLTVPGGSATFIEDGTCASDAECSGGFTCVNSRCQSKTGQIQVITVHNDKIPMQPPGGDNPTLAFAIMPHTVHFDPPAPFEMPNVDGREPGEVVSLYSYDHDLGQFVIVGTATVSEDGQTIKSEKGQGMRKGGWHLVPPIPVAPINLVSTCRVDVCTDCGSPVCPTPPPNAQPISCWKCRLNALGQPANCCGQSSDGVPVCCNINPTTGDVSSCSGGTTTLPIWSEQVPGQYSPDYSCFRTDLSFGPECLRPRTSNAVCRRGHDPEYDRLSEGWGECIIPTVDNSDNNIMCCPAMHVCTGGGQTVCCAQPCENNLCP